MQGWLYLSVILDLYSRMVVGWSMSGNCDEKLIENALVWTEEESVNIT